MDEQTAHRYAAADSHRYPQDLVGRAEAIYATPDLAGVAVWTWAKTRHALRTNTALPLVYAMQVDPTGLNAYSVAEWNSVFERVQRGWSSDYSSYWFSGIALSEFEQVRTVAMEHAAIEKANAQEQDEFWWPEPEWANPTAWEVLVARSAIVSMEAITLEQVLAACEPGSYEYQDLSSVMDQLACREPLTRTDPACETVSA